MTNPLAHLEDAEASIMSFITRLNATPEDAPEEEQPDVLAVLMATLRSVSRAAGAIEAMQPRLIICSCDPDDFALTDSDCPTHGVR